MPYRFVVVAACALGAAPAPSAAKWVHGQVSLAARQATVVTKFCFDFNADCRAENCSDAQKPGMMDFNLSSGKALAGGGGGNGSSLAKKEAGAAAKPELYLALLDDEYFSYPEVSQIWGEANCTDVLKASKKSLRLDWVKVQTGAGEELKMPLAGKDRPRWWYIALVSCSPNPYTLSYSMHLQNHLRGWQREFSMDAMGVFATTLCLTLAFGGVLYAQLQSVSEWRGLGRNGQTAELHPVLAMLTYSAALSVGGTACWLLYYWHYMQNGEARELWAVLARVGIISAKTLMQIMLMLLAQGRCVCNPDVTWAEHRELVGGMVLFGCLSLCLEVWGDNEFWSTTTEFVYDTRPGCAMVAFDLLWLYQFSTRSYSTFCQETRAKPRRFYWRYGPLFGLWFATLPLLAALARAVASWVRFGVTFAVGGAAHAAALAALVHSFRPSVAVELYELRTHKFEAINDDELHGLVGEEDDMI